MKKHPSSAALAFVRGITRRPANYPHKGPVTRKMYPFDDVIMVYINEALFHKMQNQNCNIFADDTIIYSFGSNAEDISSKLQRTLDTIMPWYMSNRLSINANKSAVMLIGKPSQIQDDVDIKINAIRNEQVHSMKYLGICIDNILSWDVQCDKLCANVAGKISVLRRIRPFCRTNTLKLLYVKTIQPVFLLCLFCLVSHKARQHLKVTTCPKLRC